MTSAFSYGSGQAARAVKIHLCAECSFSISLPSPAQASPGEPSQPAQPAQPSPGEPRRAQSASPAGSSLPSQPLCVVAKFVTAKALCLYRVAAPKICRRGRLRHPVAFVACPWRRDALCIMLCAPVLTLLCSQATRAHRPSRNSARCRLGHYIRLVLGAAFSRASCGSRLCDAVVYGLCGSLSHSIQFIDVRRVVGTHVSIFPAVPRSCRGSLFPG